MQVRTDPEEVSEQQVRAGPYLLHPAHPVGIAPDVDRLGAETVLSLDDILFASVDVNLVTGLDALFDLFHVRFRVPLLRVAVVERSRRVDRHLPGFVPDQKWPAIHTSVDGSVATVACVLRILLARPVVGQALLPGVLPLHRPVEFHRRSGELDHTIARCPDCLDIDRVVLSEAKRRAEPRETVQKHRHHHCQHHHNRDRYSRGHTSLLSNRLITFLWRLSGRVLLSTHDRNSGPKLEVESVSGARIGVTVTRRRRNIS
ncbi:MAG: hypothetical protein J07HX64_01345 [halophilic archaeon J07HX64]|nr:MAG: hypothetical protein J07HX64_01345 [halophilic archaeon J07HX64]